MVKYTINLNHIGPQNAHLALYDKGYGSYYFIGDDNRERNLAGSPLSMGPTSPASYRQWLWDKILRAHVASALRAEAAYVVHEDCAQIAVLVGRAAKWYKKNVQMAHNVCTVCLTYLTDDNKGDFHMCANCAWSGEDDDPDSDSLDQDFTFFCGDYDKRMYDCIKKKMCGQCSPCREKERRGP